MMDQQGEERRFMNLLFDRWIEVERRSGRRERIAPVQLTADAEDPVVDLLAPRADFRSALYQFFIGLLQTAYGPRDLSEWKARWNEPPGEAELKSAFEPYQAAFELDSAGPAFMQDFDLMADAEAAPIDDLLIDTRSESNAYYNKPSHNDGFCAHCAAIALFTLQVNAPAGGRGYQTSVRGGGPFSTMLMPADANASLWRRIWLNILPVPELLDDVSARKAHEHKRIFPWLSPTLIGGKHGQVTTPEMVSALQCYWCMPRRIRLNLRSKISGVCGLCGESSNDFYTDYRFESGGTDYKGAWVHPLTPYSIMAKPGEASSPTPFKTPSGGVGYRHWLSLTIGNDEKQPSAATVVTHFNRFNHKLPKDGQMARLWCFGYDMVPGQAKALCWYDSILPLHIVATDLQLDFTKAVKTLVDVASETASLLHDHVIAARFDRPTVDKNGKVKCKKRPSTNPSEPAVKQGFWQHSEAKFYELLDRFVKADLEDEAALAPLYRDWLLATRGLALRQFDEWVLAAPNESVCTRCIVNARNDLGKQLNIHKAMKPLWQLVNTHIKESA